MSAIQGRYLHASTLVRNQLYIHGGKTSKGESDELFVYSRGKFFNFFVILFSI